VTIALVVFDLDGTLVDSRRDLADSANELLAEYGAPRLADRDIVGMVGGGAATLVTRVLAAAGVDARIDEALPRFLSLYDQRLTHFTKPYPGIPEMLDELRGGDMSMALLTNKPLQQSITILERFALAQHFQWLVGGDGPWPRKPSPDGLRSLMHQASAGPGDTVLIGDSVVDLRTARSAGVRLCLARYGFGYADVPVAELRGEDALVDAAADIAGVLHEG
jgi:phosphoglycolate phosphatase